MSATHPLHIGEDENGGGVGLDGPASEPPPRVTTALLADNPPRRRKRTGSAHGSDGVNSGPKSLGRKAGPADEGDEPSDPVEQRKSAMNQLFGFRPWDMPLSKQAAEKTSLSDTQPSDDQSLAVTRLKNLIWTILFGWWLALAFVVAGVVLAVTIVALPYARQSFRLAAFFFYPFGIYVMERIPAGVEGKSSSGSVLATPWRSPVLNAVAYGVWLLVLLFVVLPVCIANMLLNWMALVSLPIAKVTGDVLQLLFTRPLAFDLLPDFKLASHLHSLRIVVYEAFSLRYIKYRVWGMHVIWINLFPVVVFLVVESYVAPLTNSGTGGLPYIPRFFLDVLCAAPISFYIGMAISSIATQTNYVVGSLLNVAFGSISYLILYGAMMRAGGLDEIIRYSVSGDFLASLLFVPGVAMIIGGMRFKTQHFNSVASGVGSLLLFVAVVGSLAPSIFYHTYGSFVQHCTACTTTEQGLGPNNETLHPVVSCGGCTFEQTEFNSDQLFLEGTRPLLYFSAAVMPLAYLVGLIFTYKTHAHVFKREKTSAEAQQEAMAAMESPPAWSIPFAVAFMLLSMALLALIAENIVRELKPVVVELNTTQTRIGVTLFALVPKVSDLINAIKFAWHDQISFSVQIGSAAGMQIALIQLPVLIVLSVIPGMTTTFALVFPLLTVFTVLFATITFNYISAEGKTDYFVGAALIIIYLSSVAAFFFVPQAINVAPTLHFQSLPDSILRR